MALDIHTKEGDHWIYGIDSGEYGHLYELFTLFYLQSGIMFDEYCDPSPLTVGHYGIKHNIELCFVGD
jgi:hypothetical protein